MRWHALLFAALVTPAVAAPVTLPARAVHYQPEVRTWAQVEPLAPLVLRTAVAAQVATVRVVPGQTVAAGQPLVTLAGPQLDSELAAARARAQAAQIDSLQHVARKLPPNARFQSRRIARRWMLRIPHGQQPKLSWPPRKRR